MGVEAPLEDHRRRRMTPPSTILDCLPQEQSKNSVMGSAVGSGIKEAFWIRTITSLWIPATRWSDAQLQGRQSAGV